MCDTVRACVCVCVHVNIHNSLAQPFINIFVSKLITVDLVWVYLLKLKL